MESRTLDGESGGVAKKSHRRRHRLRRRTSCSQATQEGSSSTLRGVVPEKERSVPPAPERVPWLVFFACGKRGKTQNFFSLASGRTHIRSVREMQRRSCLMVSQYGWLLMKEQRGGGGCFLLNPASMEVIQLPPLPPSKYYNHSPSRSGCILTAPPTDPNCTVCFYEWGKPRLMFLHLFRKKTWCVMRYQLLDPTDFILDVVVCSEKIYGFTHHRRSLTIDFDPYPRMKLIDSAREVRSLFAGHTYSRALVESCGELYLVFQLYLSPWNGRSVLAFEILKMDFSKMDWVPVESIGDRAFFLCYGGRSFSCSATESGVEGDSIYYVVSRDPCLYRFDLADGSITRDYLPGRNLSCPWSEAFWVLPLLHD